MIKRLAIIILCYFAFIGTSYSQFRIGATLGGNSTTLLGDTPNDAVFVSDIGYSAGINADYFLSNDISILLQTFYTKKNSALQYDVDFQYEPYDSLNISIDYLEIPISVKVTAGNNIAYVLAGISLNMTLSAMTKENPSNSETDITEALESMSLSANFGVGVQFNVGKPLLFVELRYSQGLSNLVSDSTINLHNIERIKGNTIQLLTGIMFTL